MSVTETVGPAATPSAPAPIHLARGARAAAQPDQPARDSARATRSPELSSSEPRSSEPRPSNAGSSDPGALDTLPPGTRVQVRRKFDDKWATGFEVAEATAGGYQVRRVSDGELIPVPIAAGDLRKEKKRSTWWY